MAARRGDHVGRIAVLVGAHLVAARAAPLVARQELALAEGAFIPDRDRKHPWAN